MEASQQFEYILEAVMGSQMNYQIQLSPFSATISVKKSFAKDKFGCAVRQYDRPTSNKAREEMNILENEIKNLLAQNEKLALDDSKLKETIAGLEAKISKAEAAALKVFEDKKIEIETHKKQVKFLNTESDKHKQEIRSLQKVIKEKDKELFKSESKCENLECSVQRLKTEVSSHKNNIKKLSKEKSIKSRQTCSASTQTCPSLLDLVSAPCSSAAPLSPMLLTPPPTASKIQPTVGSVTDISYIPGPPLASDPVISSLVAAAQTALSSPQTSPARQPAPLASLHSPCTPPGRPTTPHPQSTCTGRLFDEKNVIKNDNFEVMVENGTYDQKKVNKCDTHEEKNVKRKCILSLEVQEILKEEQFDFKKLVEAVRNDKMDFDLPQDEKDHSYSDLEYEDYPDEYLDDEIKSITDEDVEHEIPDEVHK